MNEIVIRDDKNPPAFLEGWSGDLGEIYQAANRGLPYSGYLERAQEHVNRMVSPKYARREKISELRKDCGWFWAWICGFLRNMHIKEISYHLFLEFPNCCNRCFKKPCSGKCTETPPDPERATREGAYLWNSSWRRKCFTLDSLADFVASIYPDNFDRSVGYAAGKLAEELGELKKASKEWAARGRKRQPREMGAVYRELADVMFWFVTVCRLIELEARHPDLSSKPANLDHVYFQIFKIGCPDCSPRSRQRRCTCQRGAELAERDLLDLQREQEIGAIGRGATGNLFDQIMHGTSGDNDVIDAEFEVKEER